MTGSKHGMNRLSRMILQHDHIVTSSPSIETLINALSKNYKTAISKTRYNAHARFTKHDCQSRCMSSSLSATSASPPATSISTSHSSSYSVWYRSLLFLPPILAAFLGKWQLDRRQWKMDLIEKRRSTLQASSSYLHASWGTFFITGVSKPIYVHDTMQYWSI